jgi:predicted transcriptional regulator
MEVHLNPDLQAKVNQWASETGRPAGELVEDAVAGYFDVLAQVRGTLDGRYDDIKSGRVQPIDGEEALTRLIAKTEAERTRSA